MMPLFSRLFVKLGGAMLAVFAAAIILIHAQPYDDSELRAFLAPPDGCPAPCWQGIRPGFTTSGEALGILAQHPWVTDITISGDTNNGIQYGSISWRWNGSQPFPAGPLDGGYLGVVRRVVRSLALQTGLVFGDLWLVMDRPEQGLFSYREWDVNTTPRIYFINYTNSQFDIFALVSCRNFWQQSSATVSLPVDATPPSDSQLISGARAASCTQ